MPLAERVQHLGRREGAFDQCSRALENHGRQLEGVGVVVDHQNLEPVESRAGCRRLGRWGGRVDAWDGAAGHLRDRQRQLDDEGRAPAFAGALRRDAAAV
jgi:hypothetical protein